MKRTFKYRIYANKQTIEKAERRLELCRHLYNVALEQRIMTYRQNCKSLTLYKQMNQLPELRKSFPEYHEVNAQSLREPLRRLDRNFKRFFKDIKKKTKVGFPRFKSTNRYNSLIFYQNGWKLVGRYLYLTKLGVFKLKLSRPTEGTIKQVIIKQSFSNKWYVCFSCDNVPEYKPRKSKKQIGIDVGIKSFCVDSDGNKIDNPKYFRQAEAILRRKQRRLTRRIKGSNRRRKARLQVAKTHEKITNQRNDFLHKLANQYIKNYGTIYVEDLKIKNMVRNRHLAKAISDSSWGKFFEMLHYKAEEAGRKVLKVPPHNTSQICSQCGEKVEKTLAVRVHRCPYCKLVMDRDENAARNILQVGQTCQALTKEAALCVA